MPDTSFWVPNGEVKSLTLHDTTVILGGHFDQVSPVTGTFARLDTATALPDPSLPKVNGTIYAMCRDSNGYIYVGGSFSRAGNMNVENLFRLSPNGVLDNSFRHAVDGPVYCLNVCETIVYIGGNFAYIDGEIRNNFGSINLVSDSLTLCAPDINGPVYCMAPDTLTQHMFIGGNFTQIGSFSPPYLAKISFTTGIPLSFNAVPWTAAPNLNHAVYSIVYASPYVYIGGEFTLFSTTSRPGLAVLAEGNGLFQTTMNANLNGSVYCIRKVGQNLFIGGSFTSSGTQSRAHIACVNMSLVLQPWNPGVNGVVKTITILDSTRFFVGGDFKLAGGDTCARGALINYTDSGTVSAWNPMINGMVYASVTDTSNRLYVGGAFFGIGGAIRNNLCAISVNTGKVTAWDPDVNAEVETVQLDGDTLYFAGDFTAVSSVMRGRIAAYDLGGDSLLPFNPGVNGLVRTIAIAPAEIYFGGNFTSLGGQPRMNIGKVNKSTAAATTWNPGCAGTVNTILVSPDWIYVAGFYNTIAGVTRMNLARLNPATGAADWNWLCDTDDGIYHAEFYNGKLALGGWFNTVNSIAAPDFAFVDTATLQVTAPAFACDGFVRTFARYGDDFFISGTFDIVNAQYQPRLVAYDEGNNNVDPWTPAPNYGPVTMEATATRIFVVGVMSTTAGVYHPYFQVLNTQWVTTVEENNAATQTLSVYPNPSSSCITIAAEPGSTSYEITDLSGKVVRTGIIASGTTETLIDISDLASGMYVLSVISSDYSKVSAPVIKN